MQFIKKWHLNCNNHISISSYILNRSRHIYYKNTHHYTFGIIMKFIITLIITLIVISPAFAKLEKNSGVKVSHSGIAEVGARYDDMGMKLPDIGSRIKSNEFERIGKIEIDLKFQPFKYNYLAFDVEYEIGLPTINIEKLYIGFLLKKNHTLKIGYQKKHFSLESIQGKSKRLFIDRSALYDHVKSFNVFGEDLMFKHQWQKEISNTENVLKTWTAIGGDASERYFLVAGSCLKLPPGKITASVIGILSQNENDDAEYFLGSLGFMGKHKYFTTDAEILGGNDPSASRIEKLMGVDRNVFFLGGRLLQAYHIPTKLNAFPEITPLWELGLTYKDLESRKRCFQVKPGLNIYIGKKKITQLMLGMDFRYSTNAPDHYEFSRHLISYMGEFKFQW